jgi:hypothetical protein
MSLQQIKTWGSLTQLQETWVKTTSSYFMSNFIGFYKAMLKRDLINKIDKINTIRKKGLGLAPPSFVSCTWWSLDGIVWCGCVHYAYVIYANAIIVQHLRKVIMRCHVTILLEEGWFYQYTAKYYGNVYAYPLPNSKMSSRKIGLFRIWKLWEKINIGWPSGMLFGVLWDQHGLNVQDQKLEIQPSLISKGLFKLLTEDAVRIS